jgi:hypothetical protein
MAITRDWTNDRSEFSQSQMTYEVKKAQWMERMRRGRERITAELPPTPSVLIRGN